MNIRSNVSCYKRRNLTFSTCRTRAVERGRLSKFPNRNWSVIFE